LEAPEERVGIFDKLFLRKPTREEFVKKVLEALAKSGARDLQHDAEERSIKVGSSDKVFYLDNAFADYTAADPGARSGVIQRYVSSFLQDTSTPKDFASAKAALLPVVRDPAYFSLSLMMLKSDGRDTSNLDYATKKITDGLVAGVAYDTEHSIMNVNRSTLKEWGVALEESLQMAILNLRERTSPNGMKEIGSGLFVSQWGDCYDSARILLPDILHRLALNGDPVIFVPNRDQLWATGKYNKAGITAMLTHGKESHFEQGHSLSPNLYAHTDGKWQLYVPEEQELRKLALSVKRQRDGIDYAQQKNYLDKLHKREEKDIFVASCQVYKRPDESLLSRCVWSKGVDSLLPETDFIVFMEDVEKKEHFSVGWHEAMPIVNSLMEKEPELMPVRYRARKFPDDGQISQLRALAK